MKISIKINLYHSQTIDLPSKASGTKDLIIRDSTGGEGFLELGPAVGLGTIIEVNSKTV